MPSYKAPVADVLFLLNDVLHIDRLGNLPRYMGYSVHSGEDVILTATGPGSARVKGSMDNTEVFRVMADTLGLGAVGQ